MKINPDCIRDIMFFLEENLAEDEYFVPNQIYESLRKYSYEEIEYCVKSLFEEKWISGIVQKQGNFYLAKEITPVGHEFLKIAHNDNFWNKTKSNLKSFSILALSTILDVAKGVATQKISKVSIGATIIKSLKK